MQERGKGVDHSYFSWHSCTQHWGWCWEYLGYLHTVRTLTQSGGHPCHKEQPHLSKSYSPPVLFWPLQRQQETGQFSVGWQTLAPVVLQLFLALPTWTAFPCVVNGCATVHVDKISPWVSCGCVCSSTLAGPCWFMLNVQNSLPLSPLEWDFHQSCSKCFPVFPAYSRGHHGEVRGSCQSLKPY